MTARKARHRVLFAGYAPVHFICFQPLYERLRRLRDVDVVLSGGRDASEAGGTRLTARTLYAPFHIPASVVRELREIREQRFDLVFCAHVSGYFPKDE
ncbi:MAG: hypothetical protein OEW77_09025, partial [Gemmatimonadota bacterium]|nr:hypothetical protein [Gemmatimonadota bacterium]